jgi:hypothetical protein
MRGYRRGNPSTALCGVSNDSPRGEVALTLFETAPYNPATIHPHHPARGTTPIGFRRLASILRAFDSALLVVAALLLSLAPFVSVTALAAGSSGRTATVSPLSLERVRTLTQDLHGATF